MHKSAYEIGHKFLERYWNPQMSSILEVGSLDVNGSLKDFQPEGSSWVGVDLEPGKGVDIVIERANRLPFEDKSFDLIVATSIFEHDPTFWLTFSEMLRVVKDGGYIYVCAPSNGWVHRYPMDVYRFYPDAGNALVEWGSTTRDQLVLIESFISEQDGDVWNDFAAVFGVGAKVPETLISSDTACTNVWRLGEFLSDLQSDRPQDMRTIVELKSEIVTLRELLESLETELEQARSLVSDVTATAKSLQTELAILKVDYEETRNDNLQRIASLESNISEFLNSKSWQITEPMRRTRRIITSILQKLTAN